MGRAFRIFRVAGIDVRVHWTFLLLVAWFAWTRSLNGGGMVGAAIGAGFILALFVCVLLHEFGHAFAARAFGIRTPDITLLPIGGVARLERMPRTPWQELVVALAGPAVNVVIAGATLLIMGVSARFGDFGETSNNFPATLASVNISLALFNLIPAFPMDGGRILRALLAMKFTYVQATKWAARVGQVLAVGFAIFGLMGNPMLLLIAIFIYSGAGQEAAFAEMQASAAAVTLGQAMITKFVVLHTIDPREVVEQTLLAHSQPVFPVLDAGQRVHAMPLREEVLQWIRSSPDATARIGDSSMRTPQTALATQPCAEALPSMQAEGTPFLAVVNPGQQLVGIVSLLHLEELSRVQG